MRTTIYFFIITLFLGGIVACENSFGDTDFINNDAAPTDVAAVFNVTQNNSGEVTITPTASGVVSYQIYFGDDTVEPAQVRAGGSVTHTYKEGSYSVKVVAVSVSGKQTEASIPLEVSFKAPENVVITAESDAAVSKGVNVTVTADYAVSYDVYFGETSNETPLSANIGEQISYVYAQAGTYTLTVVVKGTAIATTTREQSVTATTLMQPSTIATTPRARNAEDVISIYGSAYTNLAGTNYNPDWGQSGQGSSFAFFSLGNHQMIQLINASYQGIQFANAVDLSQMEYVHLDVWTADVTSLETSLISQGSGEKPVKQNLTAENWTSIDIPLSAFTNQGLSVKDIHQIKFVASPWAKGTVFIDNIYFYKKPDTNSVLIQNFEGTAPTLTSFGNIPDASVVNNPEVSSANTTAKAARVSKTNGSETWAGTFFETSALDLKTYPKIRVKTRSPKANATVLVKLENANSSVSYETGMPTTVTDKWEELIFDMSAAPDAQYTRIVIFFDFGTKGDGSVYYFDEVKLTK